MAGTAAAGDERDDVSRVNHDADEELMLQAIRRQLDSEFPKVEATGNADWEAEGIRKTQQDERPRSRPRQVRILLGTLLFVGVVGTVAGTPTTTLRVGGVAPAGVDSPAVADREAPSPPLEVVRTRSRVPTRTRPSSNPSVPSPWATNGLPTAMAHPATVQGP